jgi:2-polyprenyl-3-methyl-5-hydroxy-6-metoxy-1,4-benzoquinol methylase
VNDKAVKQSHHSFRLEMKIPTPMKPALSGAKRAAKQLILRTVGPRLVASDFRRSRARLLEEKGPIRVKARTHGLHVVSPLTQAEKELLQGVSLNVHPFDTMYVPGQADHYMLVGLSAIRCIEAALESANIKVNGIRNILDFPVGYGRILRFLKAKYSEARICGAELDLPAMKFCVEQFSIETVTAPQDFSMLSTPEKFDLIWCGSLITHLNEKSAIALLRLFRDHLTDNGICVVSAHGQTSAEWLRRKKCTYGLTPLEQEKVLQQYAQSGYGYGDYPDALGYGISLASPERMKKFISELGTCVFFQTTAWDHHHDVYGFQK